MLNKSFLLLVMLTLAFALVGCEGDMIPSPTAPDEPVLVNPIIDLFSNPLGADVLVFQLSLEDKAIEMGEPVFVGQTPVVGRELEPGSYIAEFSAEGYDTKIIGMRLAYGDTNGSYTVDLSLSPVDPPEIEAVWADFYTSADTIILGDTFTVTASTNGLLGILNLDQFQEFMEDGTFTFPFTPTETGERLISMMAIGIGGDYAVHNSVVNVLPKPVEPEVVTLNAWIVGSNIIPAGSNGYFAWAASANADSVTADEYYTDGNIGLSGERSPIEVLQDMVLVLHVWKDGEIKDSKSLEFFVQPPEPMSTPELSFHASSYEIENDNPMWSDHLASDGEQVFLIWNVKYYDEMIDEVVIDRMMTYGDLGPRGLIPVTVSSDTTFTMTVYRDGQEVTSKMVRIFLTEGPINQPDYIDLSWHFEGWVGQRSQDPHQIDLMSGIRLPANVGIDVWTVLEYSPVSEGQDDESCALGFLTDTSEHWAYLDNPDCPVFPDQGEDIREMFYIGRVSDFSEEDGRMVMRTGADFDCWDKALKCNNPNSVHLSEVKLRVHLQQASQ